MLFPTILAAVALPALIHAHPGGLGIIGAPAHLLRGLQARNHESHAEHLESLQQRRDAPNCGIQANNASCPQDQCCSKDGYCGNERVNCDAPQCQVDFGPACDANKVPGGTNTSSVPRPQLGNVPYTGRIKTCTEDKTVALTYDDGPYLYSLDLYNILAKHNAKATFFVTGINLGKHAIDDNNTPWPQLLKYAYDQGHQIAQHTWSHPVLDKLTQTQQYNEIIKLEMALRNVLGFFPSYFRPPYEACQTYSGCTQVITELGYHTIMQDVDPDDYVNYTPETSDYLFGNFTKGITGANASNNHIVYVHEQIQPTVYNLTEYMITTLASEGYKFVTVGECLGDPVENWYRNATTGEAVQPVTFGVDPPQGPLSVTQPSAKGSGDTVANVGGTDTISSETGKPVGSSANQSGTSNGTVSSNSNSSGGSGSSKSTTSDGNTAIVPTAAALTLSAIYVVFELYT